MPDFRRFTSSRPISETLDYQRFGVGERPADGLTAATAARSALQLMQNGQTSSGIYWINPGGLYTDVPLQIYCDLTFDGGGWMLAFALHKGRTPVANVSEYFSSPQAAATGTSQALSVVARTNDPLQSYCLPENFWRMSGSERNGRGEIREEYAISGGTWPSNTNRVVSFHGGRTSAGLAGNFLTENLMATARTTLGFNGRLATSYRFMGQISRGGYSSNSINFETPYTGAGNNSIVGISVDATTLNTERNLSSGTNQAAAAGASWMGRGNCCGLGAGSSTNGGEPNGTRWGLIFIR